MNWEKFSSKKDEKQLIDKRIRSVDNFHDLYQVIQEENAWINPIYGDRLIPPEKLIGQIERMVKNVEREKERYDDFGAKRIIELTRLMEKSHGLRDKVRELLFKKYFDAEKEIEGATTIQGMCVAMEKIGGIRGNDGNMYYYFELNRLIRRSEFSEIDRIYYQRALQEVANKEIIYRQIEKQAEKKVSRIPAIDIIRIRLKKIVINDFFSWMEGQNDNQNKREKSSRYGNRNNKQEEGFDGYEAEALENFFTYSGMNREELKNANIMEIKKCQRMFSKKYHPDIVRNMDISEKEKEKKVLIFKKVFPIFEQEIRKKG